MQVHNSPGDVLDLFDHENDIDFETAYQMLSGTLDELDTRPVSPYKELRHPEIHTPGATFANPVTTHPSTPNVLTTLIPTGMTPTHQLNNVNDNNNFKNIRFSPESSHSRFMYDYSHDISNSKGIDSKMTPLTGTQEMLLPSKINSPNYDYPEMHNGSQLLFRLPGVTQNNPSIMTQEISKIAPKNEYVHKIISEEHFRSAELLSTYESNAIENFLDNLISTNPLHEEEHKPIENEIKKTESDKEEIKRPESVQKKTSKEEEKVKELENPNNINLPEVQGTTIDNYEVKPRPKRVFKPVKNYPQNTIEIPGITIADEDIPVDIRGDVAKVRKWKHVQLEKIRRTQSKNAFEDLIKLIDASDLKAEKRVPKYKLLNCVMDDIQNLMKANEQLESMLET